jgi:hypothetical protein
VSQRITRNGGLPAASWFRPLTEADVGTAAIEQTVVVDDPALP